jgi:subtilisin family serine protease
MAKLKMPTAVLAFCAILASYPVLAAPISIDFELVQFLGKHGYSAAEDGSIVDDKTCQTVTRGHLASKGVAYDSKGRLVWRKAGDDDLPIERRGFILYLISSMQNELGAPWRDPQPQDSIPAFEACREKHWNREGPVALDKDLAVFLKEKGFEVRRDGAFRRLGAQQTISREALHQVGLGFSWEGRLVLVRGLEPAKLATFAFMGKKPRETVDIMVTASGQTEAPRKDISGVLETLFGFSEARGLSPKVLGEVLRSWGVPPAFNGLKILNPDGTATPYGLLLYQGLSKNPRGLARLSQERVAKAMGAARRAVETGFDAKAPSYKSVSGLSKAWDDLGRERMSSGEKPLDQREHPEMKVLLDGYQKELAGRSAGLKGKHGLGEQRRDAKKALEALNALEKHHYYTDLKLPEVPSPAGQRRAAARRGVAPPPLSHLLPVVLRVLDGIGDGPLDGEQAEALIKSFPMGESVWRMGVQELWKEGLTGKGVKVAVIDQGVHEHRELDAAVRGRKDFTGRRDLLPQEDHATHVSGTIHALAPDAEIRSYKVFDERMRGKTHGEESTIMKAIDAAVRDGNRIINMSLGGEIDGKMPEIRTLAKINKYAKQGVIFVISAGNDLDEGVKGISAPSVAREAFSSGALDVSGRNAAFSQHGRTYDPARRKDVYKTLYMTPGTSIVSSVAGQGYGLKSGTSMSAPHLAGAMGLLWGGAHQADAKLGSAALSRKIRGAVTASARPMPEEDRPEGARKKQEFLIVDPVAAWRRSLAPTL